MDVIPIGQGYNITTTKGMCVGKHERCARRKIKNFNTSKINFDS